jgi:Carboxypeptidase regulatory-like domain/TonB-dependent Receptor Plug Domain
MFCQAQTTEGVIFGTITDQMTGRPLSANVVCENAQSQLQRITKTSAGGEYALTLLPPGTYRLTVDAGPGYRPAQVYNLQLSVAGFLQQNFSMRLLTDLWQSSQPRSVVSKDGKTVLMFYGPDVDTSRTMAIEKDDGIHGSLEPSISQVVEPLLIDNLPLAGRDVYTMIALQPGVTSDTSTTRGLGVSVNGQRPSSSKYLLDGLQNNNYLITGPLSIVPPEAIQEYRISTNNFSAEYGGTSGFLANAVTKSGSNQWHGDGYYYFKNEALNANDFQRNVQGLSRLPLRENQAGFQIGGPTGIRGLFTSTLVEYTRDRAWEDATAFLFPTPAYIAGLSPGSLAAQILTQFRPPAADAAGNALIRKPNTINRTIALERVDYDPLSNKDRAFARLSIYRQSQPNFMWSPYSAFSSGLDSNTTALAGGDTHVFGNKTTGEIRGSFETDLLGWRPPNQNIPALAVPGETLPGTPASYFFQNHGKSGELNASLITTAGKHVLKMGGGWVGRWINGAITEPGSTLKYHFANLAAFAGDQPKSMDLATTRVAAATNQYMEPQQARTYRYNQWFLFAQDSVRVTSRLLVHLGVRYDSFGSPINIGTAKDWLIHLGPGDNFPQRLTTATMPQPDSSDQPLYSADHSNWAVRAGFAYNLQRNGRSVFRAGYGIFFDRPFDNLWLNISLNNAVPATAVLPGTKLDYLQPPSVILANKPVTANVALQPITFFQPGIRTPYAQSFFAGIQQALSARWSLDLNYSASLGRRLLTNDLVNRVDSICVNGFETECRYNSTYNNDFDYRANQGGSDFHALTAATKIRARHGLIGVNYTWSHSIDNQSEPLAGLSTNLEVTGSSPISPRPAQFTEQFNSSGDRGSSDFDQRQSVTFYSTWNFAAPPTWGRIASLMRDWQISQIGAIRSGQPYTVYVNSLNNLAIHVMGAPGEVLYNRANLAEASVPRNAGSPSGGVLLFNPAAFADPVNELGSPGRNAFTGPGLYSIDLSLSRSFALPRIGESARLIFRIDAYNAFNHANLNNPSLASSSCCLANNPYFGTAYYGQQNLGSNLPVISPRNETARQLQLMLKIVF